MPSTNLPYPHLSPTTKTPHPTPTTTHTTNKQVRVRFTTRDARLSLPQHLADAPLAVPVQLNRKGLSEVVHHLRGNPSDEEAGYDFAIDGQLLRCSLDNFLRATGVSTVRAFFGCLGVWVVAMPVVCLGAHKRGYQAPSYL